LIEFAVYASLAIIVGAQVVQVARTSARTTAESDAYSRLAERNRAVLHRIGSEVRSSIRTSVGVEQAGSRLVLTEAAGFDGVAVVTGDTIAYELQTATGEQANGVDDNGNGLVDEGRLVRVNQTTGESVTLCESLDLAQCGFTLNGSTVESQLTSQGFIHQSGEVLRRSRTVAMTPRN